MTNEGVWKQIRDELNPIIEELKREETEGDRMFIFFALTLRCRRADAQICKLPETSFTLCARGDLQRYLATYDQMGKFNFTEAKKYYLKAVELNPEDGRPHHQLSVLHLAERKPLQAAAPLLRACVLRFITREEANHWFLKISQRPGNLNDVPRNARKAVSKLCAAVAGEDESPVELSGDSFEETEWLEWLAAIIVNVSEEAWVHDWLLEIAKWCLKAKTQSSLAALRLLSENTNLPVELHLPSAIAIRKIDRLAVSAVAALRVTKCAVAPAKPCLIVIDGLNVAKALDKTFSPDSLLSACTFFTLRGHAVLVILPHSKKWASMKEVLKDKIMFTPAKDSDDSYAIEYARRHDGCVVSNDLYRDWIAEQNDRFEAELWRRTHVISFAITPQCEFIPDPRFVFPLDP